MLEHFIAEEVVEGLNQYAVAFEVDCVVFTGYDVFHGVIVVVFVIFGLTVTVDVSATFSDAFTVAVIL